MAKTVQYTHSIVQTIECGAGSNKVLIIIIIKAFDTETQSWSVTQKGNSLKVFNNKL